LEWDETACNARAASEALPPCVRSRRLRHPATLPARPPLELDPRLRELGQTRAGFLRESRIVFSQHCKAARDVGLSEEKIREIPTWTTSEVFTPAERAVLAYTDELVLQNGRVQDATFERLRAHLSVEEIRATRCTPS
jgi:alkylhydroperoxidase family enzyme